MPVTTAVALVVLASWGVVLVTRGRVRRAVAAIGALASAGCVAAVVIGWSSVTDSLRSDLAGVGVTDVSFSHTAWFWAAAVGALLSLVAPVLAVRLVPTWPRWAAGTTRR
ncbi:Trp biosynthesis-associated membrane protein [Nocardioides ungokensis]|uniref:Trp biosynthesis-associated membrane protein n=1 Tax=Nocardioides ungokensis TaxID=1643322 RepID=UPI0015DFF867|nr:Trp biosynthesis-associated membrane protein [Nocardioides ungokensis]